MCQETGGCWEEAADDDLHCLEDQAGTQVPLVLFVPRDQRGRQPERRAGKPEQRLQIRNAAERLREPCADMLKEDLARFHDRAAEWKRVTGRDRSYQKRVLP